MNDNNNQERIKKEKELMNKIGENARKAISIINNRKNGDKK